MRADDDDVALVRAWRRGDPGAVRRVVDLHAAAMTRVALALGPGGDDAEDLVQEALLSVHGNLEAFDPRRGSLRAWLVGVTANRARRLRRARGRYGGFLARFRRERYESVGPDTGRADLAFARRRLASLSPREREAFVLVEIEEMTSAEAGAAMGIADSTVRVLVGRARARLQASTDGTGRAVLRAEGGER